MDQTLGSVVDSVLNKAGDWSKIRSHIVPSGKMSKMILEYCEATNPATASVVRHMLTGTESSEELENIFRRVASNDRVSLEVFDLIKMYKKS